VWLSISGDLETHAQGLFEDAFRFEHKILDVGQPLIERSRISEALMEVVYFCLFVLTLFFPF